VRSLYDDIYATLDEHDFSIPNVRVRKPYDESNKTYPLIVLHEITNLPKTQNTVSGEERTVLGYQLDILTRACTDNTGAVLSMWDASRRLMAEVTDLLSEQYALTRRAGRPAQTVAPDVLSTIWRGECVEDSYGYSYRR
jgi:hypothetical protein